MAAVTIPDSLIKRLQGLGPHFCKVYSEQKKHPDPKQNWKKRPVGNDWQNRLMFADDPKLQEWLAEGGNYGVCGGYGLVIADADIPEVKQILEEKLPETFTVESPGSKGWHAYFLCGLEKPIRLRDKNKENVGDIQGPNKMVLGPRSIHPNGGEYRIVKDLPLAQVTAQQLKEVLKEWIVPEKEIQQVEFAASQEKRNNVDLDILQVVPLSGLRKRGAEYFGPHPIHGSKTRQNFWVNPSKNCWHCFRHGSGGGPLLWLAVEEGIIDCSEAGQGALRGEVFKRTIKIARERGLITQKQKKTKKGEKENGTDSKEKIVNVSRKITETFIAEEVYNPPNLPQFAVKYFDRDEIEFQDIISLGEKDAKNRDIIYHPVMNDHISKGMVVLPRKPVKCTVQEVVKEAFAFVKTNFDPCGKVSELELFTIIPISGWFIEKEKPIIVVAGTGVFAPILACRGPSGSGKNRLANLLRFLSYHPLLQLSTYRIPSLYRPLDIWKGTLIIDECDVKNSGETSQLIHFLNSRATGTPIGRQNPESPSKCDAFESFGITIVTQRKHFDDNATEGRTVPNYCDVTENKKITTMLTIKEIKRGLDLQDKLLYLRLTLWDKFFIDKTLWVENVSDHRLNSTLLPAMALAEFDPSLKEIIVKNVLVLHEERRRLRAQSDDGMMVNFLWEKIETGLWGLHNGFYYVGSEKETYVGVDEEEYEKVIPLTTSKISELLGQKITSRSIRKNITGLNIDPENAPTRIRLSQKIFRPILFDVIKMEKRLREFVVEYQNNTLYEKLELPKPVTHVTDVTDNVTGGLDQYTKKTKKPLEREASVTTVTSVTKTKKKQKAHSKVDEAFLSTTCFLCGKALPRDLTDCTKVDKKLVHKNCAISFKVGRKKQKYCDHLDLENQICKHPEGNERGIVNIQLCSLEASKNCDLLHPEEEASSK